ncbi:AAA family ATPase [Novipirellula sp. SH528]|uniref:bifunctional aminoglycoside phosphotransferase/ATP-binding protein n=1 Tax=Novipirellula sp. SH528 TaxID=3454466 RepID=UPI003F9EE00B
MNSTDTNLVESLHHPDAFPDSSATVEFHETHISWVFLVGDYAYKIKKPVKTEFLDYSTLEKRQRLCWEELRLDSRFANDLYLDVVPICIVDGKLRVEGKGIPLEYAVKMRRFPSGALLSERLKAGKLTVHEVSQLSETIADFHQSAARCEQADAVSWPAFVFYNMNSMLRQLKQACCAQTVTMIYAVEQWSESVIRENGHQFTQRAEDGFIRECHGDLHLENVVNWQGRFIPFDGIEFNPRMRWIDVMSDAAFLMMDFAARGHLEFGRSFANHYLQRTGDYESLHTLRWFLVYRAIVRGLVASIRANQSDVSMAERDEAIADCRSHIALAHQFTTEESPVLWITHGVSGSGKTTKSELVVQQQDCFRLRSDVERKRMFGLQPTDRSSPPGLYSDESTTATYDRLSKLAKDILRSGYSVVVDATFLEQSQRSRFRDLAFSEGVSFAILDCQADNATLHQRVADRNKRNADASDADRAVLQHQLETRQPLTSEERQHVAEPLAAEPPLEQSSQGS